MESVDDDDDVKLMQASAALLSDLESALPKILWRPSTSGSDRIRVHTRVRQRDLEHVIKLVWLDGD